MTLTAELYEQVLQAIRPSRRRTNDARRLARVGVAFRLEIRRADPSESAPKLIVQMRDLSPTGFGFVSREPLGLGERIVAALPRASLERLLIVANVKFCKRIDHQIYHVGAQFVADSDGTDYTRRAVEVRNAVPTSG